MIEAMGLKIIASSVQVIMKIYQAVQKLLMGEYRQRQTAILE
jgi:hypothetical protein